MQVGVDVHAPATVLGGPRLQAGGSCRPRRRISSAPTALTPLRVIEEGVPLTNSQGQRPGPQGVLGSQKNLDAAKALKIQQQRFQLEQRQELQRVQNAERDAAAAERKAASLVMRVLGLGGVRAGRWLLT